MKSLVSQQLTRRIRFHVGIATKTTVPCGIASKATVVWRALPPLKRRLGYSSIVSVVPHKLKGSREFHVSVVSPKLQGSVQCSA
jgi:hypothetical protein